MKKSLLLSTLGIGAALFGGGCRNCNDLDNAPRTPERDDIMQIVEQSNNPLLEEIYRRRALHKNKLLHTYPIPEIKADSVAEWEKSKADLLKIFEDELYGKVPPAPEKMEMQLLSEKDNALDGLAIRREYRLKFYNQGRTFDFDMLLYVPKNPPKPVPFFVGLNFSGNQYNTPDLDVRQTRGTNWKKGRWKQSSAAMPWHRLATAKSIPTTPKVCAKVSTRSFMTPKTCAPITRSPCPNTKKVSAVLKLRFRRGRGV